MLRTRIFGLVVVAALASCGGSSGETAVDPDTGAGPTDAADAPGSPDTPDAPTCTPPVPTKLDASKALSITGNTPYNGIYDPSLVYPVGAPGGVLIYSSVSLPIDVHTRVAVTTDKGASFTYVGEVNAATPITVDVADGSCASPCKGTLWHEVPSVVADPSDPDPNRAFKVFTHSYVSLDAGTNLRRDVGYIGLFTAKAPDATWSKEAKLIGWKGVSSLSSGATLDLSTIPALADCVALTEPAAVLTPSGIDLAITCLAPGPAFRIELLRSRDHAAHFSYVGKILDGKDTSCLGTNFVNGADLFFVGAQEYLVVTPILPVTQPVGTDYAGCWTMPIADVAKGTVARDASGAPKIVRALAASDGRFAGPCTFAEGATAAGYLFPQAFPDGIPDVFRIVATGLPAE